MLSHIQCCRSNLELVRQMQAQGVPLWQIASRLNIPRTTLRDHLKRTLLTKTTAMDIRGSTDVHTSGSTEVHLGGAPNVHIDLPLADLADFHAMLAWWRRRKYLLAQANNAPAPTER